MIKFLFFIVVICQDVEQLLTTTLPSGEDIPILGQGTWRMGENPQLKAAEPKALRYGLERGLTLIDTAEMYGDGGAELLVSEVIAERRDDVFIVSKVLPTNAGYKETISACERSLKRLKTDRLDLYLLHWRGTFLSEYGGCLSGISFQGENSALGC